MAGRNAKKKVEQEKYNHLFPNITSLEKQAPKATEDELIRRKRDSLQEKLEEVERVCQKEGYTPERIRQIETIGQMLDKIDLELLKRAEIKLEQGTQKPNLDEKIPRNDQPNIRAWAMSESEKEVASEPSKQGKPTAAGLAASLPEEIRSLTVDQFLAGVLTSTDPKHLAGALDATNTMAKIVELQVKTVCGIETDGKIGLKRTWSQYTSKAGEKKTHIHEQFRYTDKTTGESTSLAVNKVSKKAR